MALGGRDEGGKGSVLSISRRLSRSAGQHVAWSSNQKLSSDNDWFAKGFGLKKPSGHRSQLLTTQKRAGSLLPQEKVMSAFLILKGRIANLERSRWRGRTMAVRSTASALAANAPHRHCGTGPNRRTSKPAAGRVLAAQPGTGGRDRLPFRSATGFLCRVALVEAARRAVAERSAWRRWRRAAALRHGADLQHR
jgi:hypothetical protein